MAANYWLSTHCTQWILDKEQVEKSNRKDRQYITADELMKLKIHFINIIQNLGVGMKMRQRAISTAIVYFKRFYVRNSFVDCEPRLIATTCMYLASKVEECTTQAKKFVLKMREIDPTFLYDMNHILECEFYLLEELDFCLVVFHPYRMLQTYLSDHNLFEHLTNNNNNNATSNVNYNDNNDNNNNNNNTNKQIGTVDKEVVETAWSVVNDSYRTDVCLLYPPHTICLASILVAMLLLGKEVKSWFAELNVDMKEVWEVSQKCLEMYEQWGADTSQATINSIRAKLITAAATASSGMGGVQWK